MKLRFYSVDEDRCLSITEKEGKTKKDCLVQFIVQEYVDYKDMEMDILDHFDEDIEITTAEQVLEEKTEKELLGLIEMINDKLSDDDSDNLRVIEDLSNHKILYENRTYIFGLD